MLETNTRLTAMTLTLGNAIASALRDAVTTADQMRKAAIIARNNLIADFDDDINGVLQQQNLDAMSAKDKADSDFKKLATKWTLTNEEYKVCVQRWYTKKKEKENREQNIANMDKTARLRDEAEIEALILAL